MTLLWKDTKNTTIIHVYRTFKGSIESAGLSTVIKKQWIPLQQSDRIDEHPHDVVIKDLIKTIKTKQKDNNEIIVAMDGNIPFTSAKGGIAKLCRNYHLYDPMDHQHGEKTESKSHIRESQKIDFIFFS